jgi:hypothetical protein
MMKRLCVVLLSTMMLCGCAYLSSKAQKNPPTPKERLCSELKRNIIFNTSSFQTGGEASPTQEAQMMRLYEKNGCDKLKK